MSASSEAGGQRAARTDHGALSGSAAPDGVSAARLDQQPEQRFARLRAPLDAEAFNDWGETEPGTPQTVPVPDDLAPSELA